MGVVCGGAGAVESDAGGGWAGGAGCTDGRSVVIGEEGLLDGEWLSSSEAGGVRDSREARWSDGVPSADPGHLSRRSVRWWGSGQAGVAMLERREGVGRGVGVAPCAVVRRVELGLAVDDVVQCGLGESQAGRIAGSRSPALSPRRYRVGRRVWHVTRQLQRRMQRDRASDSRQADRDAVKRWPGGLAARAAHDETPAAHSTHYPPFRLDAGAKCEWSRRQPGSVSAGDRSIECTARS